MSQAWTSNSVYKALTNLQAVLEIHFLRLVLQLSMLMLLQTLTSKAKQLRECLGDCGVTILGALMNHFLSITMDTAEKVCCVDWQPTLSKVTHMKSCTQIRWTCNCRNRRSKCKMENINFCVVYVENVKLGINKPCLLFVHVPWNAFGT